MFYSSKCGIQLTRTAIAQWSKVHVSHLMVERSSQLWSRFLLHTVLNTANMFITYSTTLFTVCFMFSCVFWFRINKQIRIYSVNITLFIINPSEFHFTRLPAHYKITNKTRKIRKSNVSTNVLPLWVYILTYASVSILNISYLFNINSRKLDGQYQCWIEYLKERY